MTETEFSDLASLFYLNIKIKSHDEEDEAASQQDKPQIKKMLISLLSALKNDAE